MRPRKPWYRSGRGWYVEINGQQICLVKGPKTTKSKAEAEHAYHCLMAEFLANCPAESPRHTVGSVLEKYLEFASKRLASSTYYEQRHYLQRFADVHGGRLVKTCIPFHLNHWVDSHATWTSEWTRSFAVRTVKRAFNWAYLEGLIPVNPFASVRQREGQRRRPLTDDEYRRLLAAAGPTSRVGLLLRFLAATGCRPCEARKLRWDEVDLVHGVAVQWIHKTSQTQKTKRPREIVLTEEALAVLKELRLANPTSEHVFLSHRNRPWARCSLQQVFRRLRRKLGLPDDARLYGLRHRFGTESILQGNDLVTTKELLGHTSTRMTEYYVNLQGQVAFLRGAAERISKRA